MGALSEWRRILWFSERKSAYQTKQNKKEREIKQKKKEKKVLSCLISVLRNKYNYIVFTRQKV